MRPPKTNSVRSCVPCRVLQRGHWSAAWPVVAHTEPSASATCLLDEKKTRDEMKPVLFYPSLLRLGQVWKGWAVWDKLVDRSLSYRWSYSVLISTQSRTETCTVENITLWLIVPLGRMCGWRERSWQAMFRVPVGLGGLQEVAGSCSSARVAWAEPRPAAESRGRGLEPSCQELPSGGTGRGQSGPQSTWAEGPAKLQLATTKPNAP